MFNHADLRTQEFFIEGANPSLNFIIDLYEQLRRHCSPDTYEVSWGIQEMARQTKCKNEMTVSSALAALMRCRAIDRFDVPGQRVKGTRLPHPDMKGIDLPISAPSLQEKERRDREKLKSVTEFAYSRGCRQQWILNYFGELDSQPCGRCDECRALGQTDAGPLGEKETDIIKKALSGVARASYKNHNGSWSGRWGRLKIIQMLKGSRNKDMVNTSLSRLSTYGILKDLSEDAIKQLFQALKLAGYLQTEGGEKPLLTLSSRGADVMTGRAEPRMVWPLPRISSTSGASHRSAPSGAMPLNQFAPLDEDLFKMLKQLRQDIASEKKVPPYIVFHNATLEAMARLKPTTRIAAMKIHGIGEHKAEQYLDDFLELIAEYEGV